MNDQHNDQPLQIVGRIVDVETGTIARGHLRVADGRIVDRQYTEEPYRPSRRDPAEADDGAPYIIPGLIDAHIHIESSMLTPSQFARLAVVHGTVATVSDPHEIANVLGLAGVEMMLADAARSEFTIAFGAPSCVPASRFETAGVRLDSVAVATLLSRPEIGYLAEMMDYPGVLAADPEVAAKIAAAHQRGRPVDGHAPGLRGAAAARYAAAGIATDHECYTLEEAYDKLAAGMQIIIREGSGARNFEALWPLMLSHPDRVMLCSDDLHPDALARGHINLLLRRAVAKGIDPIVALRCASLNVIRHYAPNGTQSSVQPTPGRLRAGLLRPGDPADFAVVRDLVDFSVVTCYLGGTCVARDGRSLLAVRENVGDTASERAPVNRFDRGPITPADIATPAAISVVRLIEVTDGELVTGHAVGSIADPAVAKLIVVNRYRDAAATPAIAFVRGFGRLRGAIAQSVAHDSHNVIAVGTDDAALARAVNAIVAMGGGLAVVDNDSESAAGAPGTAAGVPGGGSGGSRAGVQPDCGSGAGAARVTQLALPIGGLMSDRDGYAVAGDFQLVDRHAKAVGCVLRSPLTTLSFLALPVIPHLKLTDLGLFDVDRGEFVSIAAGEEPAAGL